VFFPQQSLQTASGVRVLIGARVSVPRVKRPWVKMTPDFHSSATELYHHPSQLYLYVYRYVCLSGVREPTKSMLEYSVYGPKEVMGGGGNRYLQFSKSCICA